MISTDALGFQIIRPSRVRDPKEHKACEVRDFWNQYALFFNLFQSKTKTNDLSSYQKPAICFF